MGGNIQMKYHPPHRGFQTSPVHCKFSDVYFAEGLQFSDSISVKTGQTRTTGHQLRSAGQPPHKTGRYADHGSPGFSENLYSYQKICAVGFICTPY